MPELPEVETIKNDLKKYLLNKTITKILIYSKKLKYKISKKLLNLKKQKIIKIKRYSKYIVINTNKGFILIHLGISGNIFILNKKIPKSKHDHIDILTNEKKIIRYNDIRKFGFWLWFNKKKKIKNIISKLGPEPLTKKLNTNYLYNITKKKKICIHQLIINQKIISGIGNIYANESLFLAKIIPNKPSCLIKKNKIKLLIKKIKLILKKSIKLKGTININKKYLNKNTGYFQKKIMVYKRNKKKCLICKKKIKSIKKNGRTLYFCNTCQK